MSEVELTSICRKYESFRLRDPHSESLLLDSILRHGVREPLQCVQVQQGDYRYILLDGFKRLRCCSKLTLQTLPVVSIGEDEAAAILRLLRSSTQRIFSILEQARFVDELHSCYGLTVAEIAGELERSPAWVRLRLGMVERMSEVVRDAVFSGRFPLRCYMYTLRQFTRVHGVCARDIDRFVGSVAGKGLSTREIAKLAHGYFRGGEPLKRQIEAGDLRWTLRQITPLEPLQLPGTEMSEAEWRVVQDLELAHKYIARILAGLNREELGSQTFRAHALLVIEGLLGNIDAFAAQIRNFHDRKADQRGCADSL
jgi:ParB/RepB/Spo0J family partition protein